ncbi:hypothetical protein [uncultured Anaerotruncus sp.]|uniref:hypothetical protein n=1 Tax=uncultured Anaerotruncus sp. TaxID=905011 RepID=UPI00280C1FA0|nr:hypothetical protein [uncultured Anaerotruncus sp.]
MIKERMCYKSKIFKSLNGLASLNRIRHEVENGYQKMEAFNMKKTLTGLLAMVLLLSITTTAAFAAGRGQGRNYVDADGDGICDRADGICNFVDADGDGVCDYRTDGTGTTYSQKFFIDADNDGVCDNYASKTPPRDGTGRGWGQGRGCRGGRGR